MKKQIRFLQPKDDGLNLARSFVNNFLRDMQKNLGKFDANRLKNMLLMDGNLNMLWDYDTALKLFNECVAANR